MHFDNFIKSDKKQKALLRINKIFDKMVMHCKVVSFIQNIIHNHYVKNENIGDY